MKRENKNLITRTRTVLLSIAAVATLALLLPTGAEAGQRHGKSRHHHKHKRHHVQRVYRPAPVKVHVHHPRHHGRYVGRAFHVPRRIVRRQFEAYNPYFHGKIYFAPHRHRHDVYYFPVRTRFGWEYRPHYYCRGELFLDTRGHVSYHGRNVSVHLDF